MSDKSEDAVLAQVEQELLQEIAQAPAEPTDPVVGAPAAAAAPPGAPVAAEEEIPESALLLVDSEQKIKHLPLTTKSRVRLTASFAMGLNELGERAKAANQLNEQGNPIIDPDHFKAEVVLPMVQALCSDLQEYDVMSLEELQDAVAHLWTGGPLDDLRKAQN